MATQAELVARVLRNLHVLEAGETADTADDALIDDCIAQVQAELTEYGLAYWALTAIPEAVMRGMVIMVSADAASAFMEKSRAAQFEADRMKGERMIRRVVATTGNRDAIVREYF